MFVTKSDCLLTVILAVTDSDCDFTESDFLCDCNSDSDCQ